MKKILHLVNDEKFIGYAQQSFTEANLVQNDFWVITPSTTLKHLDFPCRLLTSAAFYSDAVQAEVNQYDLLIIHFLDAKYDPLLADAHLKPEIVWIGWGGDYYWMVDTLPFFHLYKPLTRKWVIKTMGHRWLYPIVKKINHVRRKKRVRLINKGIRYFAPVLPDDYHLILKNYPDFQPKYLQWNYGNLEQNYIKGYEDFTVSGNDILIGNSATPTNNHLDVFKVLSSITFDKQLLLPLNYGDMHYSTIIKQQAERMFSHQAKVLTDFMPYAAYMGLLQHCGNVIMGHVRQQALGNIVAMLYVGAKVYFYKDSVTYQFFKNKGFTVYTLEDLQANPKLLDSSLDVVTIQAHRSKLQTIWGKEQNTVNTQQVIALAL